MKGEWNYIEFETKIILSYSLYCYVNRLVLKLMKIIEPLLSYIHHSFKPFYFFLCYLCTFSLSGALFHVKMTLQNSPLMQSTFYLFIRGSYLYFLNVYTFSIISCKTNHFSTFLNNYICKCRTKPITSVIPNTKP